MGTNNSFKSADSKKSYAQLEAENAILKEQLVEAKAVIQELKDRIQNFIAKDTHNDNPRSPMCG